MHCEISPLYSASEGRNTGFTISLQTATLTLRLRSLRQCSLPSPLPPRNLPSFLGTYPLFRGLTLFSQKLGANPQKEAQKLGILGYKLRVGVLNHRSHAAIRRKICNCSGLAANSPVSGAFSGLCPENFPALANLLFSFNLVFSLKAREIRTLIRTQALAELFASFWM